MKLQNFATFVIALYIHCTAQEATSYYVMAKVDLVTNVLKIAKKFFIALKIHHKILKIPIHATFLDIVKLAMSQKNLIICVS
jgi:hypothetical protein